MIESEFSLPMILVSQEVFTLLEGTIKRTDSE
jgi:hypothetical protein